MEFSDTQNTCKSLDPCVTPNEFWLWNIGENTFLKVCDIEQPEWKIILRIKFSFLSVVCYLKIAYDGVGWAGSHLPRKLAYLKKVYDGVGWAGYHLPRKMACLKNVYDGVGWAGSHLPRNVA